MSNTMTARKNTMCRYCSSNKLSLFLSLGKQPPSNSFIKPDQVGQEIKYPLDVYFCESCYLTQLIDVVDPHIIFDDYAYLSSTSVALKKHYEQLTQILSKRFPLQGGDVVVDIGCNDGILLNGYKKSGLTRIGVEPSQVAKIAQASGLEVIKDFFGPDVTKKIVKKYGQAKIVTATNVFAHVDTIAHFVKGIPTLIGENGVFVIEAPYLVDMVDQTLFDTIYHEHLCYLSITPLISFLNKFGLTIFDVERVPFGASGPAMRVFIQQKNGKQRINDSVSKMTAFEKKWGIGNFKNYTNFAKKVALVKKEVLKVLQTARDTDATIGGYGAPAKGNTLLNFFEINSSIIPYIAETNTLKQGLLTPGSHIPIISEEEFIKRMPKFALLLSWNYLDFFLEKSDYIKKGGKFIVPLPKAHIVS